MPKPARIFPLTTSSYLIISKTKLILNSSPQKALPQTASTYKTTMTTGLPATNDVTDDDDENCCYGTNPISFWRYLEAPKVMLEMAERHASESAMPRFLTVPMRKMGTSETEPRYL